MDRERHPLARRGFLSGLASLPLIGGSVALIGSPSKAAVPVTDELMQSYKAWLYMEHRMVSFELAGHDRKLAREIEPFFGPDTPGWNWHLQWTGRGPAGWIDAPAALDTGGCRAQRRRCAAAERGLCLMA